MKENLSITKNGVQLSRSYSIEEDGIEKIKAVNRGMIAFNDAMNFKPVFNADSDKHRNIKLKTDNLYTIYN